MDDNGHPGPAAGTQETPQTEPVDAAGEETQGKPLTKPVATVNTESSAPNKAPTPAGRPPPPKPVRGGKQPKENNGSSGLKESESTAGSKTEESVGSTEGSRSVTTPPPKKVPTRRPPPLRQSSTQQTSSKTETSAPSTAVEGENKTAPAKRRPAGPRPMSRPHSMVVQPSNKGSEDSVNTSIAALPPAPETESETSDANKNEGAASVPGKSPVVKRPPALRPSSRPRSMLVKSATISDEAPARSEAPKSTKELGHITGSPSNKKKASPQVKRPPAPRPAAPKRSLVGNKQTVPIISEASTGNSTSTSSEKLDGQNSISVPASGTGGAMSSEKLPSESADNCEPEPTEKEPKKPLRRPPPPIAGRQKETKTDSNVVAATSDIPTSIPDSQDGEGTNAEREHLQEEETKTPAAVTASPAKKSSLSKPPPPVTVKPKSRSPTPNGSTLPETLTESQPVHKPSTVPPPSTKRVSIKKPPPPVTAKPKSRSPTPTSLTPPEQGSLSKEPSPQTPNSTAQSSTADSLSLIPEHSVEPSANQVKAELQPAHETIVDDKSGQDSAGDVTGVVKTEQDVDSIQDEVPVKSRPPRPAPTAKVRPPPPRAPQRTTLNRSPSCDSTEYKVGPTSSPSQTRTGSFKGKRSPTSQRAPSPKQSKRSGSGGSTGEFVCFHC